MSETYDPDGNPISIEEMEQYKDRKRVAWTKIGDGVNVSTVWLAINHNPLGYPPLIFETMVFGGPHDQYQQRYSTWQEAEKGHQQIVEWLRGEGPWCGEVVVGYWCLRPPGHDDDHLIEHDGQQIEWRKV